MSTIFDARRRALEESFFAEQSAELLDRLRRKDADKGRRLQLSAASGIRDRTLLDEMVALKLEAQTLTALTLVPLILVAWADGSVRPEEHLAVMNAAATEGIEEGTPAFRLLEGWLEQTPEPRLEETWRGYVAALTHDLSPKSRIALRDQIIGRARKVAEAAGGFLGLGNRISKSEERMLCELEIAFL